MAILRAFSGLAGTPAPGQPLSLKCATCRGEGRTFSGRVGLARRDPAWGRGATCASGSPDRPGYTVTEPSPLPRSILLPRDADTEPSTLLRPSMASGGPSPMNAPHRSLASDEPSPMLALDDRGCGANHEAHRSRYRRDVHRRRIRRHRDERHSHPQGADHPRRSVARHARCGARALRARGALPGRGSDTCFTAPPSRPTRFSPTTALAPA